MLNFLILCVSRFLVHILFYFNYLANQFPGESFALLCDNCSAHKCQEDFDNLKVIFFPKNTTGLLQPLDLCLFGMLKSKYRAWLAKEKLEKNVSKVNEETAVLKTLDIFNDLTVPQINSGFKKSQLDKIFIGPHEDCQISKNCVLEELNEKLELLDVMEKQNEKA